MHAFIVTRPKQPILLLVYHELMNLTYYKAIQYTKNIRKSICQKNNCSWQHVSGEIFAVTLQIISRLFRLLWNINPSPFTVLCKYIFFLNKKNLIYYFTFVKFVKIGLNCIITLYISLKKKNKLKLRFQKAVYND